ncbi:selenocysteine-specific translation elongation factor [Nonomuraea sp. NEAU-A123]|uniref:selenocysteine-specific translation elongation factor n=1 Tax=Nonomuraea sp. NEAU-A123 TaxID=2839649 RepID=UPI001BE43962|nr:selenocysteine-specific translation elongation factor [Nonomuraea sp. NEAU-A123]MBT2232218.1 selenocysteine-specific translation elongation factor [Nonomuraea sp. NEAU-A123]
MYVVATAGHVDHGKSTLVRALTGMEPDRLAEERRRGLTIELGYAWTTLPSGRRLAFVDVPGHERFLGTMLAGVGPVPAVMFVVAADGGWMPQSEEHLVALEALGVRHCLLVVTRADLADPGAALEQARTRLTTAVLEAVVVSGRTGQGLGELREALDRLVARLPPPDAEAPVRLWIDRAFSVTGSGTVVTGTLPAGTISVGDELALGGESVRVRALEALKEPMSSVAGVARVAVNLRGHGLPERGQALVTPGRWTYTDLVDVRISPVGGRRDAGEEWRLPRRLIAHIGSAAVGCEVRMLGGRVVRVRLARPLPLHLGDVLLLRDPGRDRAEVRVLAGASVLDVRPPALGRRGAARAHAARLESAAPDAASALRIHRLLRAADLIAMVGTSSADTKVGALSAGPVCGDWYADPEYWAELAERLTATARRYAVEHPLEPGMPLEAARHELGLPDRQLVAALVRPPLTLAEGRIMTGPAGLPAPVVRAVERLRGELAAHPFQAPEAGRLAELGLGSREVAAAVRAGRLLRVTDGIVLLPGADARAAEVLSRLPQPFTVSQARNALDTSRRVAVPLLEHLDRSGLTQRVDEAHRRCL